MDGDLKYESPREIAERERFEQLSIAARRSAAHEVARWKRLIRNLKVDLEKHGDPDEWKHIGDLILANIQTAKRDGDMISVIDYFSDDLREISIEVDRNRPLSEIAESYFRRYIKARNGKAIIGERLAETETALAIAIENLALVEASIEAGDTDFLTSITEPRRKVTEGVRKKKKDVVFNGARSFISSDGFEILVGKKAADNDFLTFRMSRSLDTWFHAADFPGSHVIVRNPNRKDIPTRTLLQAAQLAAFYSGARELGKAAVNYTLRKFVNKPKRSAPGLVSLSSFKTLLVEPKVDPEISNK